MSYEELRRLRRLRADALRLRAVVRKLTEKNQLPNQEWPQRASGCAWRVSRSVSGHLRAHPCASFQRDVGKVAALGHSLRASIVAFCIQEPFHASAFLRGEFARLAVSFSNAQALTLAPRLIDEFSRSMLETKVLLDEINEISSNRREARPHLDAKTTERATYGVESAIVSPYLNF